MYNNLVWSKIESLFSLGKEGTQQNQTNLSRLSLTWIPRPLAGLGLAWGHILFGDPDISTGIQLCLAIPCWSPSPPVLLWASRFQGFLCELSHRVQVLLTSLDVLAWHVLRGDEVCGVPWEWSECQVRMRPVGLREAASEKIALVSQPHTASASTLPYTDIKARH